MYSYFVLSVNTTHLESQIKRVINKPLLGTSVHVPDESDTSAIPPVHYCRIAELYYVGMYFHGAGVRAIGILADSSVRPNRPSK